MQSLSTGSDGSDTRGPAHGSRRVRGFTLIEILMVVAIVAILAAIAVPSYLEHVVRSNSSAAQQWLLEISSMQAGYLLDARAYGTLGDVGMAVPPDRVNDFYAINLVMNQDCAGNAVNPGYCVSAAPRAGTPQQGEPTLQVDHQGNRLPVAAWK